MSFTVKIAFSLLFPFATVVLVILDGSLLFWLLFLIAIVLAVISFFILKKIQKAKGVLFSLKSSMAFLSCCLFLTALVTRKVNFPYNFSFGFQ